MLEANTFDGKDLLRAVDVRHYDLGRAERAGHLVAAAGLQPTPELRFTHVRDLLFEHFRANEVLDWRLAFAKVTRMLPNDRKGDFLALFDASP